MQNQEIILISRCVKTLKNSYQFNFWGVLLGHKINKVILEGEEKIKRGDDYLVHAKINLVGEGVLRGQIIRIKNIEDISLFE